MRTSNEVKKEAAPKIPKAKRQPATKADKPLPEKAKPVKKAKDEGQPVDRLPSSIDELKASKSGLVAYLFLSGIRVSWGTARLRRLEIARTIGALCDRCRSGNPPPKCPIPDAQRPPFCPERNTQEP